MHIIEDKHQKLKLDSKSKRIFYEI